MADFGFFWLNIGLIWFILAHFDLFWRIVGELWLILTKITPIPMQNLIFLGTYM